MSNILTSVGNIPPIHWLLHSTPVEWIGGILGDLFAQMPLQWAEDRFGWIVFMTIALGGLGLEMLWWLWAWIRAKQIGYDQYKATHWPTGLQAGKLREKPVDIEKGLYRRYAWPLVGLPFAIVAVGMYSFYLVWPGSASRMLLTGLWLLFLMPRRAWTILISRKAFKANNPGATLETTWLQDVWNYYATGYTRPAQQRKHVEPPFVDVDENGKVRRLYRIMNNIHAAFSRYGLFWRMFQVWNIVRFWGLLANLLIAFCWPIACIGAPFYYMLIVHEYKERLTAWWRAYRKNEYRGKVVPGKVIARDGKLA